MIHSGKNKYNVQPVCPYFPETLSHITFSTGDLSSVIYAPAANKCILIFNIVWTFRCTADGGYVYLSKRDNVPNTLAYLMRGYGANGTYREGHKEYVVPFEICNDDDLYLTGNNIANLAGSIDYIERTFE